MITIVVASYKYGHLAAHCVESILSQSVKPAKILFVDDCVGDCKHIHRLYPEVEYFENIENYGTVKNFQNMLEKVNTEYCMFVGADNWLRSDAIECMHKIIDLDAPDIVTYDIVLTGEKKQTRIPHHKDEVRRYKGDYYWTKKNSHHGSMVYRTKLAKQVGGYTKIEHNFIHTCEDWSLWNKMIAAGAKVSYIPDGLLYYRHHRENFNSY